MYTGASKAYLKRQRQTKYAQSIHALMSYMYLHRLPLGLFEELATFGFQLFSIQFGIEQRQSLAVSRVRPSILILFPTFLLSRCLFSSVNDFISLVVFTPSIPGIIYRTPNLKVLTLAWSQHKGYGRVEYSAPWDRFKASNGQ